MTHIKISKGLDIPMQGRPIGLPLTVIGKGEQSPLAEPKQIALNLRSFDEIKFRLLVKVGDIVQIGQPLAEDKATPGRMFVSPAGGAVVEIKRGQKRSLQEIVIEPAREEQFVQHELLDIEKATREEITRYLMAAGLFASIRSRPFDLLADPAKAPRAIFVKALESAPCAPPAELQVQGYEHEFQAGLNALGKLTSGPIHLIMHKNTTCRAFLEAANVTKHTAEGPHPIANYSVHIEAIDPIGSSNDLIWTLSALDVVSLGHLISTGKAFINRVISIAGPGILPDRIGYFTLRAGFPVSALIANRLEHGKMRLIAGDPLMGKKVEQDGFLGYSDTAFTVVPENTEREFLHFMGLGADKYSFSRAYLSGHLNNAHREYEFTTNQHGEHRPFIDSSLYQKVMPLNVPTMLLVKAVMAEDYESAATLGLLEVASEDFALPTFVCPSKMEMTEIMDLGIKRYAKEVLA
jgi:Na+-transporting NADH:ubiquinone oxidoreductase subunit A